MRRLSVDFENGSSTWWDSGGRELWEGIAEGFDGSSVTLDDDLAESWLAEASKIAGWEDGPEYAPHPIRMAPLADDEEE